MRACVGTHVRSLLQRASELRELLGQGRVGGRLTGVPLELRHGTQTPLAALSRAAAAACAAAACAAAACAAGVGAPLALRAASGMVESEVPHDG